MKLLIAVDSPISTEVLVEAVGIRPWPDGTTAHVLSIVADMDVTEEVWREEGYGRRAIQREMKRRGEQITALSVERLRNVGIPAEVVVARGDARSLIPFYARKWSSDLIFVRAHVRKDFSGGAKLGRRPDRRRLTRAARFQEIPPGKCVRSGRYERAVCAVHAKVKPDRVSHLKETAARV